MRSDLIAEVFGVSAHIQQSVAGQVEYDDFLLAGLLGFKSLVHGSLDSMG